MRDPLIELWMVIANSKNEGVKEYLYKTKNHLKCCRESKYFLARWQAETDRGRVTKLEDTQKSWKKTNRERKKKRGIIYRRMCFHIGKIDTFCCNIDAAFVFLMNNLMPLCFVNIGPKKRRRRRRRNYSEHSDLSVCELEKTINGRNPHFLYINELTSKAQLNYLLRLKIQDFTLTRIIHT